MNGNQIRKLRQKLDLDPVLFSRLLGVHLSTVYRWEQSRRNPKIDIMQKQLLEFIDRAKVMTTLGHLRIMVAQHPLDGLRTLLSWT